ncbi:MAG: hypothetical protein AAF531_11630 [Actinomycetota bacterium]
MSDQIFWYVTRSSAMISWLGAALSMVAGLVTSSRLLGRRPTIPWLVDLHRGFAGLSMVFLLVHLVSLYLDGYVQFGILDLLVPWVATVPGLTRSSLAYGVIAAWLLLLVQLTSYAKDRLPSDVWRTVHLTSYASLGFGTLHAVEAGSDMDNPIVLAVGVSVLAALFVVSAVRAVRLKTGTLRTVPEDDRSKPTRPEILGAKPEEDPLRPTRPEIHRTMPEKPVRPTRPGTISPLPEEKPVRPTRSGTRPPVPPPRRVSRGSG